MAESDQNQKDTVEEEGVPTHYRSNPADHSSSGIKRNKKLVEEASQSQDVGGKQKGVFGI